MNPSEPQEVPGACLAQRGRGLRAGGAAWVEAQRHKELGPRAEWKDMSVRSAEARSCAVFGFCSTNHGKLLKGVRSLWQLCLEWSEGGQSSGHQCGGWRVAWEGEDSVRNWDGGGQQVQKLHGSLMKNRMWEGREGCSQNGLHLLAWGCKGCVPGGRLVGEPDGGGRTRAGF